MARWLLRVAIAATLLLIAAHFSYALKNFNAWTLESVQFAELGLPLLFSAFINGVVWTTTGPSALARATAHITNALMLAFALLVAWLAPVAPAYLVVFCSALLTLSGIISDAFRARAAPAAAAQASS